MQNQATAYFLRMQQEFILSFALLSSAGVWDIAAVRLLRSDFSIAGAAGLAREASFFSFTGRLCRRAAGAEAAAGCRRSEPFQHPFRRRSASLSPCK